MATSERIQTSLSRLLSAGRYCVLSTSCGCIIKWAKGYVDKILPQPWLLPKSCLAGRNPYAQLQNLKGRINILWPRRLSIRARLCMESSLPPNPIFSSSMKRWKNSSVSRPKATFFILYFPLERSSDRARWAPQKVFVDCWKLYNGSDFVTLQRAFQKRCQLLWVSSTVYTM